MDAVFGQVPLKPRDVFGQRVADQRGAAGFLGGLHQGVAVQGGKFFGERLDVLALVAVFGEGHGLLALVELEVAGREALAELLDLVARVVHIEFAGHIVAGPVQHGGQAIAQSPAPGVAQVHGAGGVGGNEFHVDRFAAAVAGAAVLPVQGGAVHHAGEPGGGQKQVDEAGAGDLGL